MTELVFEDLDIKEPPVFMTKYQCAMLLAERCKDLAKGDPPRIKVANRWNIYDIAVQELKRGVIPLKIAITLPTGEEKILNPNKMSIRDH